MRTHFVVRHMVVIASLVLGLQQVVGALATQAASQPSTPPAQSLSTRSDMASGAVEDTLKACMTRIPKNASLGQRMIAVESCERDQVDRKSMEAVPGAEYAAQ